MNKDSVAVTTVGEIYIFGWKQENCHQKMMLKRVMHTLFLERGRSFLDRCGRKSEFCYERDLSYLLDQIDDLHLRARWQNLFGLSITSGNVHPFLQSQEFRDRFAENLMTWTAGRLTSSPEVLQLERELQRGECMFLDMDQQYIMKRLDPEVQRWRQSHATMDLALPNELVQQIQNYCVPFPTDRVIWEGIMLQWDCFSNFMFYCTRHIQSCKEITQAAWFATDQKKEICVLFYYSSERMPKMHRMALLSDALMHQCIYLENCVRDANNRSNERLDDVICEMEKTTLDMICEYA